MLPHNLQGLIKVGTDYSGTGIKTWLDIRDYWVIVRNGGQPNHGNPWLAFSPKKLDGYGMPIESNQYIFLFAQTKKLLFDSIQNTINIDTEKWTKQECIYCKNKRAARGFVVCLDCYNLQNQVRQDALSGWYLGKS